MKDGHEPTCGKILCVQLFVALKLPKFT